MSSSDVLRPQVPAGRFLAPDLGSVPGLHAVTHRLGSIVVIPTLGAWRGVDGVTMPRGTLLYGAPDPARDAFVGALAGELDVPVVDVDVLGVASTPITSTPTSDRAVLRIDPLAGGAAGLLDSLGQIEPTRRPLVVATTDSPWDVDPELLVPGRFDRLVFVPPPDWDARHWRLSIGASTRGLDIVTHLEELTAATTGWTGGDIETLLDSLSSGSSAPTGPAMLDVLAGIRPTATDWLIEARTMVNARPNRGWFDDLVGYLHRMRLA